jgi:hypothetical protein
MRGEITPFPDVYAKIDTNRLLDAYRGGPERVRRALAGLSDDALRARPIPGKWSALEIAAHVADSELVGATRIRLVLGGDQPPLPGYDQDRWSRSLGYQAFDSPRLEHTLALFTVLRETTLPWLAHATAADWSRTGVHPEYGPVTLRNLLELYADHSERHIEQIATRRELLGQPIALASLLPERLY